MNARGAARSGKKRLGVIGTFVWDEIHGRDARRAPIEECGGITYALAAFDAALSDEWELVPLVKVGSDLAPQLREFLRSLRRLAPDAAPIEVTQRNNRVVLRYLDDDRRTETLSGGVPGWTWAGLQPLLHDIDALYVNFISGFELDLPTAQLLRQHFKGPIYADLHSLMMQLEPSGLRTFAPLADVPLWCRCFNHIQLNEQELTFLAPDPLALAATALHNGVQHLFVTLGARGVVYFADGSPMRTALVPAASPRATGGFFDTTGCGDVWGATYYSRSLAGDTLEDAMRRACEAAARNVEHKGASGLAHHLRGELHPL